MCKTYSNSSEGILNAFKDKYTNGPIKDYNDKIKVLKRISFGVRNFKRFLTRIIESKIIMALNTVMGWDSDIDMPPVYLTKSQKKAVLEL